MTPTEQVVAKTPTAKAGRFALLAALLHAGGTGASALSRLKPAIKSRPKQSVGSGVGLVGLSMPTPFKAQNGLRPLLVASLASLCALAGVLALFTPAPASALVFTGVSFGPGGTNATAFTEPSAVGVDQSTGAIYVEDAKANTVEKFNSKHEKEAFEGLNPSISEGLLTGFSFNSSRETQLAVDSTSHNFYVVNRGTSTVRAFQSDGEKALFTETGTNELGGIGTEVCGVAVDANGDVYVGVYGSGVHVFAPSGKPLTEFAPSVNKACNLAALPPSPLNPTGAVYVDDFSGEGNGATKFVPSEFPVTSATTYGEVPVPVDANPGSSVVVDPATNEVYVDEQTQIARYEASGTLRETFPAGGGGAGALTASFGLAVNSATGEVYVSDTEGAHQVEVFGEKSVVLSVSIEAASGVSESGLTLHGSVNGEGNKLTECFFEYGETTAYGHTAECEPAAGAIPETGATAVEATLTGLPPARARHFRLLAADEGGFKASSGDLSVNRPAIVSESASQVTNDSASLETEVNPQGMDTTYHLTYGPTTACGGTECSVPVPDAGIGKGATPVALSQPIQGLTADTSYHYRVLARNALGQESGTEQTFTTHPTGEFQLPDNRQWQMVSPPHKQGALFAGIDENFVIQAAADGHAITYVADYPTETEPAGYTTDPAGGLQVFSSRGAGGWQTRDLTVPHETDPGVPVGSPNEYQFFSRDLSQAGLHPFGHLISCTEGRQPPACMSPAASVQTAFLQDTSTGSFTPLVTGCLAGVPCPAAVEEAANELPGALSEPAQCGSTAVPCGPSLGGGATPDFAHVILGGLVEWSAGVKGLAQLRPVGLLPPKEGKALPAEFPALGHPEEHGAFVTRNAISSDGSRVVFEARDEGTPHLYLRVNATQPESAAEGERCVEPARACTLRLDAGLEGIPQFQAASSSGSRVFFTETTGPDSGDLFVYEVGAAKPKPVPVATGVLGLIPGSSEDGSYVYFVSNSAEPAGVPVPGAVNGTCLGVSGLCNLYVAHDSGGGWGAPRLVAVLAGQDENDWSPTQKSLPNLTARVSPDGRWLAFMSQRSLTSYDNTDVDEHPTKKEEELGVGSLVRVRHHDEEVFEYHAPDHLEVEGGSLVCASCNPTGERPHGVKGAPVGQLFNGFAVWREVFLAANVPGWTPFALSRADYQSRYLSDSGRLFFDAHDALVPEDVNGTGDVYEYQPEGIGTCTSSSSSGSAVYRPVRAFEGGEEPAGCVALISSGTSAQESAFLDASESGSDVFFLTTSKLVAQDFDSALDVYDAHECTGSSPCPPSQPAAPAACETEASCKAAPTPQPTIYGAPPSATFNGRGNLAPAPPARPKAETNAQKLAKALKACHAKKNKKKRQACVRHARKEFSPSKKAKK